MHVAQIICLFYFFLFDRVKFNILCFFFVRFPANEDLNSQPRSVSTPLGFNPLVTKPTHSINPTNYNTKANITQSYPTNIPSFHHSSKLNMSNQHDSLLKNFQQHNEDLQRKLRITTEMCAEQDARYEKSFKDMELKFRRAIAERDELLKLRYIYEINIDSVPY